MKRQVASMHKGWGGTKITGSRLTAMMAALFFLAALEGKIGALTPQEYTVEVTAQIQSSPAQITLNWPADPFAAAYRIYRKSITDTSWGNPVASLSGDTTSFTDVNVINFAAYEYQIEEPFTDGGTAYGYIYAGLAAPFAGLRGKIVLIVDNAFSTNLATELNQLQQDFAGDGWFVLRHDVSRADSVESVKALIKADYETDPGNVNSVFLFGHVPVPYSGDLNPDMHPDHKGAWPADAYYGDMDGTWTDQSVSDEQSEDPRNHNVPGDGKFDQSDLPSTVALEVGRVDFANLPAFLPKTEQDLLRQYLVKDHRYRHKLFDVQRRALVRDNFGEIDGDAPATDAWRNFTPFFGLSNIRVAQAGEFFPFLNSGSYLWAYGCGGGAMNKADGVGSTTDFAQNDPQAVFYILHGSYFGDWDGEDNFLRAALATPSFSLVSSWSGLPHWFLHHMALGETIGFCVRLAQNNTGLYQNMANFSMAQVHISLMGDPTLRMHVAAPPAALAASIGDHVTLTWQSSSDLVEGYYIYRADNPAGPFARLNRQMVTGTTFTDTTAASGSVTYMVRAIKLESSPSGTYQNPSQGIFTTVSVSGNALPTIGVVATDSSAAENGDTGTFLIVRNGSLDQPLTINFVLSGSASNGVDYASVGTPVTIPAGLGSATVTINPIEDNLVEGDETVILSLTAGDYLVGPQNSATVIIHDSPPKSETTLSISGVRAGNPILRFDGYPGHTYLLEVAPDLVHWSVLSTGPSSSTNLIEYTDTETGGSAARFYRIVWQ